MRHLIAMALLLATLSGEELRIKAEAFEADEKRGVSVFTGSVEIKKGSDELNASKVTIFVDAKRKPTKFIAEKDVSFRIEAHNHAVYRGTAQKAVFLPQQKEYQFYDDVTLEQLDQKKQIVGDEVIVNLQEGRAVAKGAAKGPVIMVFDIDDTNGSK